MEQSSGRIDTGTYFNDNQHGIWKYRYLNGKIDQETYNQGDLVKTETIQSAQYSQKGSSAVPGRRDTGSRGPLKSNTMPASGTGPMLGTPQVSLGSKLEPRNFKGQQYATQREMTNSQMVQMRDRE